MPKKSISSAHGPEGRDGTLTHLFTEGTRLYQDARLDKWIEQAWRSGLLHRFRADEGIKLGHRRLAELLAETGPALTADDNREVDRIAATYVAEYTQVVLAMASAGDARLLIPVDLWPSIPPRYPHTDVTSTVFQCMINLAREQVGLFTKGKLLVNRHYTLLLAHLLVFPEEIHHARDVPPPYPWPFVIRLDAEGTPHLDRQADITKRQWPLAERIEKELQRQFKQAGRLPNRSLPKTAKTPDAGLERHEMSVKRRSVAEVVRQGHEVAPQQELDVHPHAWACRGCAGEGRHSHQY